MMNKIYLKIFIPMIELNLDILVPPGKMISSLKRNLSKQINEITESYFPQKDICIYNKITGDTYDDNKTLKDSRLKNGDELIII